MLLGSHLSVAGGLEKALEAAHRFRFNTLALFVRNQRQWRCPPLAEAVVTKFHRLRDRLGIGPVVAHGSYLLNLAGSPEVRGKSIRAIREDLDRCNRLGIEYLVIHPGSNRQAEDGIRVIADGLNEIAASEDSHWGRMACRLLLETTAGAGNSIGGRFEQLAAILSLLHRPERFGVCLDACHAFAAGYDIRTPQAYAKTMALLDRTVGLPCLRAIHLSDCRGGLGGHLDRHEHIGKGRIGRMGFANFVNDPRLDRVPMILETPKGEDSRGRDWDLINANVLRRLRRGG